MLDLLTWFLAIIVMSHLTLVLAVQTFSGPICPDGLNADWGRIDLISTHSILWGYKFWGGQIHCYSNTGALVPETYLNKVPLNGCPADASLESIAATRTFIDNKCKGDLFLEDLASYGVLTGEDGRAQLFNRSSDNAISDELTDGTIVVPEYFPHNRVDRLAPMAKDLWVAILASNREGSLVFRKVDSLHRGHLADLVDEFVAEDGASITRTASRELITDANEPPSGSDGIDGASSTARLRPGRRHTGAEELH